MLARFSQVQLTIAGMTILAGLVMLAGVFGSTEALSQQASVFNGDNPAPWIAHPDAPADDYGVFHFRRVIDLDTVPDSFTVHVSADNRYRLLVNGSPVSSGPQRADLEHWRYETIDLAPFLQPGPNVLGAIVWNWGAERPLAQFSDQTAFFLQGEGSVASLADTGPEWKVLQNPGYLPLPVSTAAAGGYYAAPPGESVDASAYPWSWTAAGFSDESWPAAVRIADGNWRLAPRSIPPMEETPIRFATVRRAQGIGVDDGFLHGSADLVIPPDTRAVLLLDQGQLTNAFTVIEASGGDGSTLTLTYAEALRDEQGRKGNRSDIEGKTANGLRDQFRFDGGERRRFETLWYRTYRYVQLEIETAARPLRIHDLHGIFTAYPFELAARFTSDLPWLEDIWEINWRGARLGARETYMDTPYYEQLQYIGDTRVQALISLYMSGDDRLVRQAIEQFDQSRIPAGITASRYPSTQEQYIPTFSLIWVAMVHDYWMHREAPDFIRRFLTGIRGVLGWYEKRIDATGLVGPIPEWPYIDWARGWQRGMPPGATDGGSIVISLQLVYALERAAEIEAAVGNNELATRNRQVAATVKAAVNRQAWNATRGLFSDTPDGSSFSQHANVLAILANAVAQDEKAALMERLLADDSLTQSTYYFSYYLLEALRESGLGDRYIDQLDPWQDMLALGLTTVPETAEPTRSDSHAWSAHPNYGLLATVLGVRPAEPGFESVRIAPALGPLQRAAGRVPHPAGDIDVRLVRTEAGGLIAEVELPPGLRGELEWNGETRALVPGEQSFSF